jgi:hypothetical protein
VGRRGLYQESHGEGSAGGVTGAVGGKAEIAGSGAVNGGDGAGALLTGRPQTGQNKAPGCAGCPHAQSAEPATPAIATAG